MTRWATFDVYGTLIDWNAGIGAALEVLWGAERAPGLLRRYHQLEPEVQAEEFHSYAEILTLTLERLAREKGLPIPEGEGGILARSLPDWPPFPEVPAALAELRERGWSIALLSNTDRDLVAASQRQLGVPADLAVVAEDVGSYKPAPAHWERFYELTTADRESHVHVAASLFHDIAPANALGLKSVWIDRGGSDASAHGADATPDLQLTDLTGLPDALDQLVPA